MVSRLSKTFQDAVDITWRLGILYIWIDSICINQDDAHEWEMECPKMGEIYGNAYLVVAASLAHDGNDGCYAFRSRRKLNMHLPQKTIGVFVRESIDHNIWQRDEPSWQLWDDSKLPLFRRAWAHQERLLAKRIVHYTHQELVWECRSSFYCECGVLDKTCSERGQFPTSLSFKARYAQVVESGSDADRLDMWFAVVDQYMSRHITRASDRLPALSAIARQIDKHGIMELYVAGMWAPWLPACLMWWSDHQRARIAGQHTPTHTRSSPSSVPTWSWLSVEGPVSTWGRNPRSLLRIKCINYQPASDDPYGPCVDASIVLEGSLVPIQITAEPVAGVLQRHSIKTTRSAESAILIPDTNPFEIPADMLRSTTSLALAFSLLELDLLNCLILMRYSDNMNTFRRLGIAELSTSHFIGSSVQQIVLI